MNNINKSLLYRSTLSAQPRPTSFLRLLVGAVLAAIASLSFVDAPIWPLLVLRIGTTELGYALALPALALLAGEHNSRAGRVSDVLGLLAGSLGLAPALRAALIGRQLPAQLAAAFGDAPPRERPGAPPRPAPLVAADLLRGVASPPVRRSRLAYVVREGRALHLDLYLPTTTDRRPPTADAPYKATRPAGDKKTARPGSQFFILNSQLAPGVVVVHGGSWQRGDSTQLPALNRYLAARGYVVAAINYRLLPDHPFPAARDDLLAAIDYLKANAAAIGLDPTRLVLLGRSAGGQLALLVAYTANDPAIRGAIGIYPAADLAYAYANPCDVRLLDGRAIVRVYLGGNPDQVPGAYAAASPITFAGPNSPPTLLIHGGRDELVSPAQSERLAARLARAGRPHLLLRLPWATHGCDAHFDGPAGQLSTFAIERFLAAITENEKRKT
jgi:acetyl esterase/lipase